MLPSETQAIGQLQHLENLQLFSCQFADPACFLRYLEVYNSFESRVLILDTAFSSLPTLQSLQHLVLYRIREEDLSKLVDCLVQLRNLQSIRLRGDSGHPPVTAQDESRLHEALPYLLSLT